MNSSSTEECANKLRTSISAHIEQSLVVAWLLLYTTLQLHVSGVGMGRGRGLGLQAPHPQSPLILPPPPKKEEEVCYQYFFYATSSY